VIKVAEGILVSEILNSVIYLELIEPVHTILVFRFDGLDSLTDPQVNELFRGKNLVVEIYRVQDRVEGNFTIILECALIIFFDEKLIIKLLVVLTVLVSKVAPFVINFVGNKVIKLLELGKIEEISFPIYIEKIPVVIAGDGFNMFDILIVMLLR
jgi:hypothetical protein